MTFKEFIKFMFDSGTDFPYHIPNHILPEVIEWCESNKVFERIMIRNMPLDQLHITNDTLWRVYFSFEPNNKEACSKFREFLNQNRFRFWWKRRKFEYFWAFNPSTRHVDKIFLKSKTEIQEAINEFVALIRKTNYLVGSENWCTGNLSCVSNMEPYGFNSFGYYDEIYFFNKKDLTLYKITK